MLAAFGALPKVTPFKLSTEPVRRVLARLGNPQDHLPPVIHVAGTNGKGSTTAFIRSIAEAHGLKVHVDTSPHLVQVNERIRVAGKLISDDDLRRHIAAVLEANAGEPLSFFEGMTAASFLAFRETPADLTIVEVGLGGRFDSTNVFRSPKVSVITPIAFDHKEFLGHHLSQIAWEKAGIIKPGSPVVSAAQVDDVYRTLLAEANYQTSPFHYLPDQLAITPEADDRVSYALGDLRIEAVELGLTGAHQFQNAALAILALRTSGVFDLNERDTRSGLKSVVWPARLQVLDKGPVTEAAGGRTVLLDGGHNPHAAVALATALRDRAPLPVILSMLATKDARPFLRSLSQIAEQIVAIPVPGPHRSHDPSYLARLAEEADIPASIAATLEDALGTIRYTPSSTVLIAGSLYMAGHVLKVNQQVIE